MLILSKSGKSGNGNPIYVFRQGRCKIDENLEPLRAVSISGGCSSGKFV